MTVRIGGPVFTVTDDAEEWALEHVRKGYAAAYCPPDSMVNDSAGITAVRQALRRHDLVLAQVGAWVNPMSDDPTERKAARDHLAGRLALADELGAGCCVDIVGSASATRWDGADPDNYSEEFRDGVIEAFREVIDAAAPRRTVMAFEMMPYYFLDGVGEYEAFLRDLARPGQVGVHVDLCNAVTDVRRYYHSGTLADEIFSALGPLVRSVHLKDLLLDDCGGTVKFREVPAGMGGIDLRAYLRAASSLDECPVMLEHLPDETTYDSAFDHVAALAHDEGVLP